MAAKITVLNNQYLINAILTLLIFIQANYT